MKKSAKAKSTNVSGWRKLAPKSSKRPATFPAFRKQAGIVGRIFLLILVLGISGLAFWWMDRAFRSDYGPLDLTGPGAPINDVTFSSDGALTLSWFANWFGPLRGRSLMEIDIDRLRMDLEKEPQIESARIVREFPSTLRIELRELNPLLVLRLRRSSGSFEDWIVGSQGTLYQGSCYSRAQLSLLPSLAVSPRTLKKMADGEGF
ncbi:MAG: FtsQ-type POTRA domain-containing protein [Verrucomicrobiota bacterium]|nr:FtsQ-type POTRA domain-containing protein [Verrucomicrobiota bacterium]